jgi:hypothetical protein
LKTQQAQRLDDAIGAARHLTCGIDVFDADEPLAVSTAGIEITADCGDE